VTATNKKPLCPIQHHDFFEGETKMKKAFLAVFCALFLTVGITEAQVVIRVPDWAWRAGYYRWDGYRYIWVPGVYTAPPYRGGRWVPGHYRQTPHGYIWVEGHWH